MGDDKLEPPLKKGNKIKTAGTDAAAAIKTANLVQKNFNLSQAPVIMDLYAARITTGATPQNTGSEQSAIIIDQAAAAASNKRKGVGEVDYTREYNLIFDQTNQITYRPKNPECTINYELTDDNNILYIKSIICEKKEGEEGGQGKILLRDTINMLQDRHGLRFTSIQLLPVAGLGSNKGLRTEAEAELNKLRRNYIDSWKLKPVGDSTLKGSVEDFMSSGFKEDNMKGGSRRSKKTKRRRHKKTTKKRRTKRRRQTKKRGKR